jgi:integrase
MPRNATNKTKLYDAHQKTLPQAKPFVIWDTYQRGLVVRFYPSGKQAFYFVYRHNNRPRWDLIGYWDQVPLQAAREECAKRACKVLQGVDPLAERIAKRGSGTFKELAARYVQDHARHHNKAWQGSEKRVAMHLLPTWGNLKADAITRADVKAVMAALRAQPALANSVKNAASAIFTWAMGEDLLDKNPCAKVKDNKTNSRERILANSEVKLFWDAFGKTADPMHGVALKVLLLTGQRSGEVLHMRREHIADGWWTLPGEPIAELGWPGTKNKKTHRVWLPRVVQDLIHDLDPEAKSGFVFAGPRGGEIEKVDGTMRAMCEALGIADKVTPHDLRRTHGSTVSLHYSHIDMDRIQNHARKSKVTRTYDRADYRQRDKQIMEATAARLLALAAGHVEEEDNVVPMVRRA